MANFFDKPRKDSIWTSLVVGLLAVGALVFGAVAIIGLAAIMLGLHTASITALFWLANHALAKVVVVKLLTLRQDFFLALSVVLIKSIFSSNKAVVVKS